MSENISATPSVETKKRFRSPPYPSISLKRAIERARQLYNKAQHHPAGIKVLGDSWEMKESSSGLWSIAAALLHFGLLKDEGVGEKRKFQLTDIALRILKDGDPNSVKRNEAIKRSALLPSIHKELWEKFGVAKDVSDFLLKNYLTLDRFEEGKAPFSEDAANDLISEYKDTVTFAELDNENIIPENDKQEESEASKDSHHEITNAKVGDFVQIELDGAFQLANPARVRAIQEHAGKSWVFIDGSETGVLMEQIRVTEKATIGTTKDIVSPPLLAIPSVTKIEPMERGEREWLRGPLSKETSYRLLVSGELGAKEIGKLIKLLTAQKEVLSEEDGANEL